MRTLACLVLLAAPAFAQVSGTLQYQDRVYDAGGFTGAEPFLPIRQAEVEIIDAGSSTLYGTGTTDDTGAFSIGGIPATTAVRVRVYARRDGPQMNLVVRNNPIADAIYVVDAGTLTTDAAGNGTVGTVDFTIASGSAPPFNIFDCGVRSFEYQATVDPDLPASPPLLTMYWEQGTTNGTFFNQALNAIFLLGPASDPDQYDDDIILHEIGHWVAFNFSADDSPGGFHSIIDQIDLRLSWSEGWAHYWSSAVRQMFPLLYPASETQVDNFGTGNSFFDLEGPSFPGLAVMATNELAVAAALWDVIDLANEGGFDQLDSLDAEVWDAFNNQIPLRTVITLEDFREGFAVVAPGSLFDLTGSELVTRIMNQLGIRYFLDGNEPDDTAGGATPLALDASFTTRTLFPIGNEDWYSVTIATPGILVAETSNLGDGGDTRVDILNAAGTLVLGTNDNKAAGNRASLATARITVPGTYRVRVVASGLIAENGTYDVTVRRRDFPPPPETRKAGYCGASAGAPSRGSRVLFLAAGLLLLWARRR